MVATAGRGWQLAPCLVALVEEADRRAPHRSRASDGSIGDAAHAVRASDHNPDASGDVLALDLTDDPAGGCDATALVHSIVGRHDTRVKYVIHDATIWRSYARPATSSGRPALAPWQPERYTGANAHERHAHISVLDTPDAKGDLRPWFPDPQEATPMSLQRDTELIVAPIGETGQWLVNTTSGLCQLLHVATPTSDHLRAFGVPAVQMDARTWSELRAQLEQIRRGAAGELARLRTEVAGLRADLTARD